MIYTHKVEYLGYLDSEDGIQPSAHKIQFIKSSPKSEFTPELAPFLDMFNFFRCCISKAVPLNGLPTNSKKDRLAWKMKAEMTFLRSGAFYGRHDCILSTKCSVVF